VRAVATASGGSIQSPWFTAEEAAAYLGFRPDKDGSIHAFYVAYRRLRIPAYRLRGTRSLRFHHDDLDAALKRARVEPNELNAECGLPIGSRSNPPSTRGRRSAA
jgi:hypothetical protein